MKLLLAVLVFCVISLGILRFLIGADFNLNDRLPGTIALGIMVVLLLNGARKLEKKNDLSK